MKILQEVSARHNGWIMTNKIPIRLTKSNTIVYFEDGQLQIVDYNEENKWKAALAYEKETL